MKKAISVLVASLLLISTLNCLIFSSAAEENNTLPEETYGTISHGLLSTNTIENNKDNTNAAAACVIDGIFPNLDFSHGLKGWYYNTFSTNKAGNEGVYPSDIAKVENGTVTIDTSDRLNGIRTMWFAPKTEDGKDVYILFGFKSSSPIKRHLRVYKRTKSTSSVVDATNTPFFTQEYSAYNDKWMGYAYNLGDISNQELSFSFNGGGDNGGNLSIKNIRLAYKNEDGTYSDIDSTNTEFYAETGEPYYGTQENGIYTPYVNNNLKNYSVSSYALNAKALPEFKNLDFSNGLKYWYLNSKLAYNDNNAYRSGYAKDIISGVEGNSITFNKGEIKDGNIAVRTMWFKAPVNSNNLAVIFKHKAASASNQTFNLYTRDNDVAIETNVQAAQTATYNAKTDWTNSAVELSDVNGKDISFSFVANTGLALKDIHLVYVNTDGTYKTYTDVYSGEVFDLNGFVLYGTKEDGIDSAGVALNLSNYPAIDILKNLDFSEGLKYWARNEGLTGKASDDGHIYENGRVTLRKLESSESSIDQSYISTVWVNLPGFVKDQEYKLYMKLGIQSPSENSYAELLSDQEGNYVNIQIKADEYVEKTTKPLILSTNASKIRVELRNKSKDTTATYGDIDVYFADKGGIADTYVNFDGSPKSFGGYGDANADGKVDITDLVRMKKYTADSSTPIYLAAANTDKVVSEAITIKALDLTAMRKLLLGIQQ